VGTIKNKVGIHGNAHCTMNLNFVVKIQNESLMSNLQVQTEQS